MEEIIIRQSSLNDFALCGVMFQKKHIEKRPALPGVAALRGGAVHAAAQYNHSQKRESHKDLPRKDIVEAAVEGFKSKKAAEGFRLTPDEMSVGVKPILARAMDSSALLAGMYADEIAPRLQPVLVEQKISLSLPGGATLQGTLDLSTDDKRIKDLKTSGKRKSQREADESLQGTVYTLLYTAFTGEQPTGFDLEVLVSSSKPEVQHLSSHRTRRDVEVLVNRINIMLNSVKAGIFSPAPIGSWICGPAYCPYFTECAYANAERLG